MKKFSISEYSKEKENCIPFYVNRGISGGDHPKYKGKEERERGSSKDTNDHYSGHHSESESSRHKDDHNYKHKPERRVDKYDRDRDSSPNRFANYN